MMTLREALEIVAAHRGHRVVVATMSSAGLWPSLSDSPLDFIYIPSSMGQAPSLGLGLALAQPQRGVIVLNGDGCTLMNLGCLVTLADHPANLYLLIVDNGLYEVTGGQPTAGAGRIDFAGLAAPPESSAFTASIRLMPAHGCGRGFVRRGASRDLFESRGTDRPEDAESTAANGRAARPLAASAYQCRMKTCRMKTIFVFHSAFFILHSALVRQTPMTL